MKRLISLMFVCFALSFPAHSQTCSIRVYWSNPGMAPADTEPNGKAFMQALMHDIDADPAICIVQNESQATESVYMLTIEGVGDKVTVSAFFETLDRQHRRGTILSNPPLEAKDYILYRIKHFTNGW
jgi:hypothetical protein